MAIKISQAVAFVNNALGNAKEQKSDFDRIYAAMDELKISMRERVQEIIRPEAENILRALKANIPLSAQQLKLLRQLIVGDAENYLRQENDYYTWHRELKRLSGIVASVNPETESLEELAAMQGSVSDALNLIPSIQRYLEARDRVLRFEQSTSNIDPMTAELLCKLIEKKLQSPND